MVVIHTHTGKTPEQVMAYANSNGRRLMRGAFESSGKTTLKVIKANTPVYNTAKYPTWAHMPHAHKVGGQLRNSIKLGKIRETKRTIKVRIHSRKRYAGYIEGGFTHVFYKVPRWIHGRFMAFTGINSVHRWVYPMRVRNALRKTFSGGSL